VLRDTKRHPNDMKGKHHGHLVKKAGRRGGSATGKSQPPRQGLKGGGEIEQSERRGMEGLKQMDMRRGPKGADGIFSD